jgi:hypothetical protein
MIGITFIRYTQSQMIGITFIRYTQSQMIRKPNNINVCRSKLMGLNKIANVSYSYLYLRERNFTYVIIIKVMAKTKDM